LNSREPSETRLRGELNLFGELWTQRRCVIPHRHVTGDVDADRIILDQDRRGVVAEYPAEDEDVKTTRYCRSGPVPFIRPRRSYVGGRIGHPSMPCPAFAANTAVDIDADPIRFHQVAAPLLSQETGSPSC
jgi:hypothetical protein